MENAKALEILMRQAVCEHDVLCEGGEKCESCVYNVSDKDFRPALDYAISVLKRHEEE